MDLLDCLAVTVARVTSVDCGVLITFAVTSNGAHTHEFRHVVSYADIVAGLTTPAQVLGSAWDAVEADVRAWASALSLAGALAQFVGKPYIPSA